MARRGENIYKREDGRWEGRYRKGRKSDGKLYYGYVYARKYGDCKEKLDQAKARYRYVSGTTKQYGTGKACDYFSYWLSEIVKPQVKASTFSNYIAIMDKWIIPSFEKRRLIKIGKEEVQRFINGLSEHKLSSGTIRNIFHVLRAAMRKAKEYGYLSVNPCDGICLPQVDKKQARLLTFTEQKRLEQAAKADKNGLAILLACYTGLRVGELCGLIWEDVDLEHGIIYVSRTIRRIQCYEPGREKSTMLISGSAKSSCSKRSIPLPDCILKLMEAHQKTASCEYVFHYQGHPLEPRTLQYRFQALLKRAGLPRINFHALRHMFATRCLELHFDVKTLSEILGHASAKMTLDRYGHSQMEHKLLAMKSLDELFIRSA